MYYIGAKKIYIKLNSVIYIVFNIVSLFPVFYVPELHIDLYLVCLIIVYD